MSIQSHRVAGRGCGNLRDYRFRARRLSLALAALVGTTWWFAFNADGQSALALPWCLASLTLLTGLVPLIIWSPTRTSYAQVVVEVTLLLGWVLLTGSVFNPLLGLLPLLSVLYRSTGERRAAIVGVALGLGGLSAISLSEATGVSPYAPEGMERATSTSMLHRTLSVLAVAGASAAALLIQPGRSRRLRGTTRHRASIRSGKARGADAPLDREYALREVIGRGGMGTVYAATRRCDGRQVAIKVLHRNLAASNDAVARFRREVLAMTRISSPRVADVLGFVACKDGLSYIVMELLMGTHLGAVLADGPWAPPVVADLLDQLAEVLAAAHALDIVHRDIKPKNIFLIGGRRASLDIRLLDFGLCRLREPADTPRVETLGAIGSPGYFAPEQVSADHGEIGPQTDVFATAVVAYRALTGVDAFAARRPADAAYEALEHTPRSPSRLIPDLPRALDPLFERALAKRPSERQTSILELARDFRTALGGERHTLSINSSTSRDPRFITQTRA